MPGAGPSRRLLLVALTLAAIFGLIFLSSYHGTPSPITKLGDKLQSSPAQNVAVDKATLSGETIMPKLGNETAKAELGRSAWKLFHTIMARFPDKPTADESTALQSYIHLFTRLYPCGECAQHFQQILNQFPPQTSSRSAAAAWACHVHNEVNKSLNKEIFDCSNIGDFYDCGCADDEKEAMREKAERMGSDEVRSVKSEKPEMSQEAKERLTGVNGRDFNIDLLTGDTPLKLEREGWTKGG